MSDVRAAGVTDSFNITVSALLLVGNEAGDDLSEKALSTEMSKSRKPQTRLLTVMFESSDNGLHIVSPNLEPDSALDTLIALVANVSKTWNAGKAR